MLRRPRQARRALHRGACRLGIPSTAANPDSAGHIVLHPCGGVYTPSNASGGPVGRGGPRRPGRGYAEP
jgi:hypothetical protein